MLADRELAQRAHYVTPSWHALFPVPYHAPSKRGQTLCLRSAVRVAAGRT
jgi:hypothetical protein